MVVGLPGGCSTSWKLTTCTIYNLNDHTTYYFVARAFDIWGSESGDSNEAYYVLQENASHCWCRTWSNGESRRQSRFRRFKFVWSGRRHTRMLLSFPTQCKPVGLHWDWRLWKIRHDHLKPCLPRIPGKKLQTFSRTSAQTFLMPCLIS